MDTEPGNPTESVAPTRAAGENGRPAAGPDPFERGVYRRLLDEGHRFGFSQAVRLLERAFADAPPLGETTAYAEAPIRLRPSTDLVFPPTDVKRVQRTGTDPARVEVVVTFMGLYGIDSPLPYPFYDHLAQDTEATAPHRDFLDLFNHRLYAFFYRAWKKYRPGLHFRSGGDDAHAQRFVSLAGVGTPHALDDTPLPPMRLAAQATVLGPRVRNAAGLEALIESFFETIDAEVIENVPRWVPIPSRHGLGDADFRLGENATVGTAVYDRAGKFRLRLGPMDLDQYLALLPGGEQAEALRKLVRLYTPDFLDFDVELKVRSEDLPPTRLGASGAKLGFTTSVGTPTEPVLSRVVDYASANARASPAC